MYNATWVQVRVKYSPGIPKHTSINNLNFGIPVGTPIYVNFGFTKFIVSLFSFFFSDIKISCISFRINIFHSRIQKYTFQNLLEYQNFHILSNLEFLKHYFDCFFLGQIYWNNFKTSRDAFQITIKNKHRKNGAFH